MWFRFLISLIAISVFYSSTLMANDFRKSALKVVEIRDGNSSVIASNLIEALSNKGYIKLVSYKFDDRVIGGVSNVMREDGRLAFDMSKQYERYLCVLNEDKCKKGYLSAIKVGDFVKIPDVYQKDFVFFGLRDIALFKMSRDGKSLSSVADKNDDLREVLHEYAGINRKSLDGENVELIKKLNNGFESSYFSGEHYGRNEKKQILVPMIGLRISFYSEFDDASILNEISRIGYGGSVVTLVSLSVNSIVSPNGAGTCECGDGGSVIKRPINEISESFKTPWVRIQAESILSEREKNAKVIVADCCMDGYKKIKFSRYLEASGSDFIDVDRKCLKHGPHVSGIVDGGGAASVIPVDIYKSKNVEGSTLNGFSLLEKELEKQVSSGGVAARVVNFSHSIDGASGSKGKSLEDHFSRIIKNYKNILFVVAAGNDGRSVRERDDLPGMEIPFRYSMRPNVLSVAALTDDGYGLWPRSNRNHGALDFAVSSSAVGQNVLSSCGGNAGFLSGTSQATPFVAAIAANVLSESKSFDVSDVKVRIMVSGDFSYLGEFKEFENGVWGGRINYDRAKNFSEDKICSRASLNLSDRTCRKWLAGSVQVFVKDSSGNGVIVSKLGWKSSKGDVRKPVQDILRMSNRGDGAFNFVYVRRANESDDLEFDVINKSINVPLSSIRSVEPVCVGDCAIEFRVASNDHGDAIAVYDIGEYLKGAPYDLNLDWK